MALSKGPRSHRLQHLNGIPRVDRSIPSANSNPTERRMTFAEAVDQPEHFCLHTAAANYVPATPEDINEMRLLRCASAMLSVPEMAKGFGCSQEFVYAKLKKYGIKLNVATILGEKSAQELAADIMEELVKEDTEPPEQPADEYTLVFGRSEEQLPELNVAKNGNINIRNCELDVTKRYVVCFRPGMQNVRLDNDKLGKEFKPSGNQFSITCKPIAAALIAAGIDLPARYRLDPAAMTGTLVP